MTVWPWRQYRSPLAASQYNHSLMTTHTAELADDAYAMHDDVRHKARNIIKRWVAPLDEIVATLLPDVTNTKPPVGSNMLARTEIDFTTRLL